MHVLQLADLATILAHHGPAMFARHSPVSRDVAHRYWVASRGRLDLWHQTMARYSQARSSGDPFRMRRWWDEHLPVMEEILTSELLTRVVTALADGIDRRLGRDEFSPIAEAVYWTHLEARNRVQSTMLDRRGCSVRDAVRLNQLRRTLETWIDMLIGQLAGHDDLLVRFGIDPSRTRLHARESMIGSTAGSWPVLAALTRSSLSESLRGKLSPAAALPQANRAVTDSILQMLRPDLFDGYGTLKSVWLQRIETAGCQSDQQIDGVLQPEVEPSDNPLGDELIAAMTMAPWLR